MSTDNILACNQKMKQCKLKRKVRGSLALEPGCFPGQRDFTEVF